MGKYDTVKNKFGKFLDNEFREHQEDIIEFALGSKKKVVAIEAPTGIGKTLCGMCIGSMGGNAIYTVHSKTLQKQILRDFPEVPSLWGRNNYKCVEFDGLTCDMCPGKKCSDCLYSIAKQRAIKSRLCVLNYHYLLTEINFVGSLSGRNMIIIDEADSLETVLADFVGISLNNRMIKDYNISFPDYKTTSSPNSIDNWKLWAGRVKDKLDRHITKLESQYNLTSDVLNEEQFEAIKKIEQLSGYITKLSMFIDNVDETWLYEERESKYGTSIHFNPTWVTKEMANKYLWRHADKFVLLSATFPYLPVLAKLLGLDTSDIDYRQYPSVFPESNRPVRYNIAGNLTYKNMETETPNVVSKVYDIINSNEHKNEKGLIHTVSYKLANEIMKIDSDRLITHTSESNRNDVIDRFMASTKPLILVSPSMARGLSLDDDLCRFVIWVKAPYLSMADKLVSSRIYGSSIGNIWYKSNMLLSIVQGAGRAVRSKEDYATTYILDQQIQKAIADNPNMVPKWFREALW